MLKCYEIFERSSPELINEIFIYLHDKEKAVYKAAIQNLAAQRKLRPVFVERKPKAERHLWLKRALSRKPADEFAIQVLQIWLLGAQRDLICEFLDQLGIPHDGKGFVDKLPPEPSSNTFKTAVNQLLERHRPETVAVYLHVFQTLDDAGWKGLEEILTSDPRLKIGQALEPTTKAVSG